MVRKSEPVSFVFSNSSVSSVRNCAVAGYPVGEEGGDGEDEDWFAALRGDQSPELHGKTMQDLDTRASATVTRRKREA